MLSRLGIRQKLSLLLTIPLIAVVMVMVPFTAERINDARSAAATARTANAAREIGGLIQILQQERLLALGYLSASTVDRSAFLAKSQESVDEVATLRADPRTTSVLAAAARPLDDLVPIRQGVVAGTVAASTAYNAYRAADTALLDALNLGRPTGVDASGQSQLGALDALMRSNEEASSVGAVLVAAATDPSLRRLLLDSQVADQQHLRRFRELVEPGQAALVDTVEGGLAGQRIRDLASRITLSTVGGTTGATEALTAAITYTDLRRLAQDRVAREIAAGADDRAASATTIAWSVTGGATALLIIVVFLGITVSRTISQPLRRLTRAAGVVAELSGAELRRVADSDSPDPAPPKLAAVEVDSEDEIGELATALNRVQATAALLLERQITTRRNVSVMFTNIARRSQNLVGRQLALIDDLERNERNPELLQRLYRLDHIATRLRRSADSLLVVSGTIDQQLTGTPSDIADIIRAALAEIEGFRVVELGEIAEAAVNASVVSDLRLLLAELLENATNFSPPGATVEVTASVSGGVCEIRIADHGVGLGTARMAEENQRLVERERLDVAPTSVLGLFVVGRLARRHGLEVSLEPSPDRGVTAVVRLPQRVFTLGPAPVGKSTPAVRVRPARVLGDTIDAIEVPQPYGTFPWFASSPSQPAIEAAVTTLEPPSDPRPVPFEGESHQSAGSTPGSPSVRASVAPMTTQPAPVWGEPYEPDVDQVPPPAPAPAPVAASAPPVWPLVPGPPMHPAPPVSPLAPTPLPQPAKGGLPRRQVAAPSADFDPVPARDGSRGGLSRRVPGTHLTDDVRDVATPAPPVPRAGRDPEAERAALNDYLSGLARGGETAADDTSSSTFAERPR